MYSQQNNSNKQHCLLSLPSVTGLQAVREMDQHIDIRGMQLKDQQSFSIPPSNSQKWDIWETIHSACDWTRHKNSFVNCVPAAAIPNNSAVEGLETKYQRAWSRYISSKLGLWCPKTSVHRQARPASWCIRSSDMFLPEQSTSYNNTNISPTMPARQSYPQPPNQNGNIWENHRFLQPGSQGLSWAARASSSWRHPSFWSEEANAQQEGEGSGARTGVKKLQMSAYNKAQWRHELHANTRCNL